MNNDEQYVPSEKAVRRAYTYYYDPAIVRRPDTEQEFDRFLARVRRDAKAEAWDEAASHAESKSWITNFRADDLRTANPYREETPND